MAIKSVQDTIHWYDTNAEQYAKAGASYFNMEHISTFAGHFFYQASVLDAGCGPGRDANLLRRHGLWVTGTDLSKGLLAVARRQFPAIPFTVGNLVALPFTSHSFDGVWSNTSLLHLETVKDVERALAEMHRVLKKPGLLHLLVKSQTGPHKTAIVADKLSRGYHRFFQYFSREEMRGLLRNAGFVVKLEKEYDEIETMPHGRPEVRLLWYLAVKEV